MKMEPTEKPVHELMKSVETLTITSSCPGLNLKHGFLRGIHHRLLKNTKLCSNEGNSARRRRPSMQLYQPPHTRSQNESNLIDLKSYEGRGDCELRTGHMSSYPTGTASLNSAIPDPESACCGMPLKRSAAKTNLVKIRSASTTLTQTHNQQGNTDSTINDCDNQVSLSTPDQESAYCGMPLKRTTAKTSLVKTSSSPSHLIGKSNSSLEGFQKKTVSPLNGLSGRRVSSMGDLKRRTNLIRNGYSLCDGGFSSPNSWTDDDEWGSTTDSDSTASSADVLKASDKHAPRFNHLVQMYVVDTTIEEVALNGYPDWAQRYIFEAYHDPSLVADDILTEIGELVAVRAWSGSQAGNYQHIAARLCQRISKKEYDAAENKTDGQSLPFQQGVLGACYRAFRERHNLQAQSRRQWRAYCILCADLLRRLHFGSAPPQLLCHVLLNIVDMQSAAGHMDNTKEVDTLVQMLSRCGEYLDAEDKPRVDEVYRSLSHKLMSAATSATIRLLLLQVIELRASRWRLSPTNRAFYV